MTVLVVVEEPSIRDLLSANFRSAGFFPIQATSTSDGRRLAGEVRPDVVLMDLDSPATADTTFATWLATGKSTVPTIMVTARLEAACGADGEICGAALCLGKPFSPRELVGHVASQLRPGDLGNAASAERRMQPALNTLSVGPIEIDEDRHVVTVHRANGRLSLDLAPAERKLLRCLMQHPDRVLGRAQILAAIWGADSGVDVRTIDQNIRRLRRRLNAVGAGSVVKTVLGFGYRFIADPL